MSRLLPILFNTDMVCAILNGEKTVTRRLGRWKIIKLNVHSNEVVAAYFTDIGKTVFLTETEAEEALQKMNEMEGKHE